MRNLGDIDRQTVAGAISTGTHGTGARLGGLASQVVGVRIVTAQGDVVEASPDERPDLFEEEETCLRLRPARPMTGAIERCEGDAPCRLPVQVRSDELLDEFLDAIAQFEP